MKRKTIEDCYSLAISKGGTFLSEKYINSRTTHKWQCSSGHTWMATYNNIQRGHWCPECAGLKRKTIEDCHSLAKSKNGSCLSNVYINIETKYLWRCSSGHTWEAIYDSIKRGTWCPKCRNNLKAQNELYEFVKSISPGAQENVNGLLKNKKFSFDVYVPSLRKSIELDGEYWHSKPEAIERDQRKNKEALESGIEILRIPFRTHWHKKNRSKGEELIKNFLSSNSRQPNI